MRGRGGDSRMQKTLFRHAGKQMLRSSKNPSYEKMTFLLLKSITQVIDLKVEINSFASR
jgi:hypothetical protein